MLVLTRKRQQQFKIGADITVTLLEIRGDQVRIGIQAPEDLLILRSELTERNRQIREES
jgi:carbon storage regulator